MIPDARAIDVSVLAARARRAYELGMLRLGAIRGALVTCLVAVLAAADVARLPSVLWLVAIFVVWTIMGYRGAILWRGALGGLGAGLAALVLPQSVLRPCCATMVSATSCSMPQVCVGAGALLGLAVALTLPRLRTTSEWTRASAGALLAAMSLVASRCTSLFLGESLGLAGGLLATAVAVSTARAWWEARQAGGAA